MTEVMDFRVTAKKSQGVYVRAAASLLKGSDEKPAVSELRVSGVGAAITAAAFVAAELEKRGLVTVVSIRTEYTELTGGARGANLQVLLRSAGGTAGTGSSSSVPASPPSGPAVLKRLLIDFDSTLNPGQGNQPLMPERVALLKPWLERWRKAGVQVFVLTASNPEVKVASLEAAGLRGHFDDVLSSSMPKKYPSKGDYLASKARKDGWVAAEQLLADDSIEAIQTCFEDGDGAERPGGALAHTLRLVQHSRVGLTADDLRLMDARCFGVAGKMTHSFSCHHDGRQSVDEADSAMKCMLDSMPAEQVKQVLLGNAEDKRREWIAGRPDWAALVAS